MAFLETLRLAFDNNLIMGNLPDKVEMEQLAEKVSKQEVGKSIESFGLFDSNTANYNTYYPNVTAEDLQPKEADFIQPVFRALSEVIVHKDFNPVDFGMNNALKKSMSLLNGATVNVDHEFAIGNALGAVKATSWQDAYKADNGVLVPAGINSKLKIDGKSHPRVARGILMDPPSIHSTSVTVQFLWDKSHANLTQDEFFQKLGSYDGDGKLIRRIATQIKRYHEISLVSHGADPYAQLVKDAQIVNPTWGDISYNSITGPQKKLQKYFLFDYKTDIINNSENNTIPLETNNNIPPSQNKVMNKAFLISLAAIFGLSLTDPGEDKEFTPEEITSIQNKASELVNINNANKITLTGNQTELDRLKAIETQYNTEKTIFAEAVSLKAFQDKETQKLRNNVKRDYKVISGKESLDNDPIATLIEGASYETLSALSSQYTTQLEEKFPLSCKKCGSNEVNRGTAATAKNEEDDKTAPKTTLRETLKDKARTKNKKINGFAD